MSYPQKSMITYCTPNTLTAITLESDDTKQFGELHVSVETHKQTMSKKPKIQSS